jgi:hypothetical protein
VSRSTRALAPFVLIGLAALAGCSNEGGATPAATVNGVEISSQEVVDELEAIRGNAPFLALQEQLNPDGVLGADEDTFNTAFVATQLSIRIQYAVVEAEIAERGIEVDEACLAAAEDDLIGQFDGGVTPDGEPIDGQALFDDFPTAYRNYLVRRNAELTALQGDLAGYGCTGIDSDEVLRTYFDEHADEFTAQYCVSILQALSQAEADDLAAQLAGGADFDDLLAAQGGSPDDSAGQCASETNVLQSLPQLLTIEPGEIADPVGLPSQDGSTIFFIARLDSVVEPTFENSREQIAGAIDQEIQSAFEEWLSTELVAAEVVVDPRYGTWNAETSAIDRPSEGTEPEPDAELVPED